MTEHIDRLRAFAHYYEKGAAVAADEVRDAMALLRDYDALAADLAATQAAFEKRGELWAQDRARLAEAERLLALAQGEHYCGPGEICISPFCVAMRAAGKPYTQPEFIEQWEADSATHRETVSE